MFLPTLRINWISINKYSIFSLADFANITSCRTWKIIKQDKIYKQKKSENVVGTKAEIQVVTAIILQGTFDIKLNWILWYM